jgi:dihydroxyacid dehydratase/phosphogluconate dehydratase
MEFPTISLHEAFAFPTSMYFRNLMAMDTEEMIGALPMDACVLIGGCDKTVPAQLMAAASADVPAIQLVTGPMLSGTVGDQRVGACTDCRRFWGDYRGGRINDGLHDRGTWHDVARGCNNSGGGGRSVAPCRNGWRAGNGFGGRSNTPVTDYDAKII